MRKPLLFFLLWIPMLFRLQAQEVINKTCAFSTILNEMAKADPAYEQESREWFRAAKNHPAARMAGISDTTYTVQVVVHVVYLGNNKYENIPDSIIVSQIDALNRDFNSRNSDTANLRSFFIPFRGNAKIKFELAKFRPNGSSTNGIEHVQGKLGTAGNSFNPILDNMKRADDLLTGLLGSGTPSWRVKNYLNIWVCDLNYLSRKCRTCLTLCDTCGALGGYSYPPANIPHWNQILIVGGDTITQNSALDRGANDGIVIDFRFFGQNNWYSNDSMSARARLRYSGGRTTVHEVGHYFGLRHTWGDAITLDTVQLTPDGCYLDDYIDDTPNNKDAFAKELSDPYNNPCDTSINSCDDPYLGVDYPDMYEDYMDYSTDLCYNLFTQQQVDFMRYILTNKRPGIITKKEVDVLANLVQNPKLKEAGISFYPNPAKNELHLQFVHLNADLHVDLIDVSGKVLRSLLINRNTTDQALDIQNLADGMYLLKFYNDGFMASDKFMKR